MVKMDILSVFRLLLVCFEDFCLLGFKFLNLYYVDKCLLMGCLILCLLFEMFFFFFLLGVVVKVKFKGDYLLFR